MNILITGATSGLGFALAEAYAREGSILFLSGRNQNNLDQITKICQEKKAQVISKIIDVKDGEGMKEWISQIGLEFGLDLVIANAGISAGTASGSESEQQIKEIFSTNIDGVLNTINPAIAVMQNQPAQEKFGTKFKGLLPIRFCKKFLDSSFFKGAVDIDIHEEPKNELTTKFEAKDRIGGRPFKGQIAIISSLAGFRGLPSSPAYSASKSCVRVYGEALRGSLAPFGIAVNVVCPGYIKTPMTDVNNFPMPFLMDVNKAAQIIKRGLSQNQSRIAFPFPLYFVVWLATLISTRITDPIFAKLPKKKSL